MTTVINTPGNNSGDGGSGWGFFLGIIVVIVVGFLIFRYGLPAIRGNDRGDSTNINVQLPDTTPDNNTPGGDTNGGSTDTTTP